MKRVEARATAQVDASDDEVQDDAAAVYGGTGPLDTNRGTADLGALPHALLPPQPAIQQPRFAECPQGLIGMVADFLRRDELVAMAQLNEHFDAEVTPLIRGYPVAKYLAIARRDMLYHPTVQHALRAAGFDPALDQENIFALLAWQKCCGMESYLPPGASGGNWLDRTIARGLRGAGDRHPILAITNNGADIACSWTSTRLSVALLKDGSLLVACRKRVRERATALVNAHAGSVAQVAVYGEEIALLLKNGSVRRFNLQAECPRVLDAASGLIGAMPAREVRAGHFTSSTVTVTMQTGGICVLDDDGFHFAAMPRDTGISHLDSGGGVSPSCVMLDGSQLAPQSYPQQRRERGLAFGVDLQFPYARMRVLLRLTSAGERQVFCLAGSGVVPVPGLTGGQVRWVCVDDGARVAHFTLVDGRTYRAGPGLPGAFYLGNERQSAPADAQVLPPPMLLQGALPRPLPPTVGPFMSTPQSPVAVRGLEARCRDARLHAVSARSADDGRIFLKCSSVRQVDGIGECIYSSPVEWRYDVPFDTVHPIR